MSLTSGSLVLFLEHSVQEFCQHALVVQSSSDIGEQRRSLKWLEEFSRHPSCWCSVLKVLSIDWSSADKNEVVWGQAATVRARADCYTHTLLYSVSVAFQLGPLPTHLQILLSHLRVFDDDKYESCAHQIYQVCKA